MRQHWIGFFVGAIVTLAATTAAGQTTTDAIKFEVDRPVAEVTEYGRALFVDGALRTEPMTCAALASSELPAGVPASTRCTTIVPKLTDAIHTVKVRLVWKGVEKETADIQIDLSQPPADPKRPKVTRQIVFTLN